MGVAGPGDVRPSRRLLGSHLADRADTTPTFVCCSLPCRRIASEIRLDLPAQYENLAYYRASFTLTVEDYRRLRDSREVTWTMLTRAHIALGIQTGRVEHIVGLYLTGEPRQKLQLCPPTDPKYNFNASESCNRIVARALHHWAGLRDRYDEGPRGEDKLGEDPKLRERFRSAWQKEMDEWQKQWPDVGQSDGSPPRPAALRTDN